MIVFFAFQSTLVIAVEYESKKIVHQSMPIHMGKY